MKGKVVNFCMALLNLLIGATIVIYVLKIPKEITELTVQEYKIVEILKIMIYIVFGLTTVLNVIGYFLNSRNALRKTGYLLAVFSVSFLFIKELPIVTFSVLAFLMIIFGTLKEHWIETNSISAISIIGIICIFCIVICGGCFIYKNLGSYILDKENENELAYKTDYFKYIKELDDKYNEVYINIKKDDLYGYINSKGEVVIDFQFDYASPFVPIVMNDKNFQMALVCKDGSTWIILKNLRKIMTYRTESMTDDYDAKKEELENVYYNILNQTEEMTFELEDAESSIVKIPAEEKDEISNVYTYSYNDKYNIVITESSFANGNSYVSVDKENPDIKYTLDCESLCYDENYLYIYRNGMIPFYDTSSKKQGWFTITGNKKVLTGKAQILDIFGDNILIKNHNDNTVYFIDSNSNCVSDVYKEIYIASDTRFIVKQSNNKYTIINENFEKVKDIEFDFVDVTLVKAGLIATGNSSNAIAFNDYDYAENMQLNIIDLDGNTVFENAKQIYNKYYNISNDTSITYAERYSEFLNNLKVINATFIGDEFYK
jgi:hypothetical protein